MARYFDKKPPTDYAALVRELKRDGPANLYLLWGEEDYLLREFVKQVEQACLEGDAGDFDAKRLEGPVPDAGEVADALDAMPFFGGRTYLELRACDVNKCRDERLHKALADIPEWCTVVITLPAGQSPDGRLGFVKQLKEKGKAVEFTPQDTDLLFRWLRRRFEAHGKTIGTEAMERLMFLSGELMNGLIPEIEKVCAYAKGDAVTVQDVEAVAHHLPEADAFEMAESIAAGDMDKAAALLTELLAGDREPMEILGVIGWQIRRLYAARVAEAEGGLPMVKEVLGARKDYAARKTLELANRFSPLTLARGVRLCAECAMRTREWGSAMDETDALKELLIRFAMESRHA